MASPVHCRTPCSCLMVVSSFPSRSGLLQVRYRCEFLEQTVYCVLSFPVGFTCDSRRTKSLWCRCSFDLLQLVPVNHHSTISSSLSSLSSSSSSVTVPCGVRYPLPGSTLSLPRSFKLEASSHLRNSDGYRIRKL